MDALSEALLHARLDGRDAMLYAPPAPFHVDIPSGVTRVHFAVDSRLIVRVDGQAMPIVLEPRDFVLVRQGLAHSIATADSTVPARELVESDRGTGAEAAPGWVTGEFRAQSELGGPSMAALPPVVHISSARPGNEWLALSLRLLLDELGQRRPGACIMISRILDLVFIHALREWSASDKVEPGWLATALDQTLAPALAAIHRNPEHPWTVDDLAALTHQSRSAFAHRFTAVVGQSPAAYVAERRMLAASKLLETTAMAVGAVAHAVGFESEAAFSRAFRRRFGRSPLAWRKRSRPRMAGVGAGASEEAPAPAQAQDSASAQESASAQDSARRAR